MTKDIKPVIDPDNNRVVFKATKQLKDRQPILADFMDGIELDLDKLLQADF